MSERIVAVDRALSILVLLHQQQREMGISDIGRELGLNKSTVHRCIASLEHQGFVYQNPETGRYRLGLTLLSMGMSIREKMTFVDIIAPFTAKLHDQCGEVINVSVMDRQTDEGYRTVMIHKEVSQHSVLSVNPELGSRTDAYVSSVGKCLLAFDPHMKESIIARQGFHAYTENSIKDMDELRQVLDEVRVKGYAVDDEERELGLFCVGVPLFNSEGTLVAAMSISGPRGRMLQEDLENKVQLLKTTAEAIKQALGSTTVGR